MCYGNTNKEATCRLPFDNSSLILIINFGTFVIFKNENTPFVGFGINELKTFVYKVWLPILMKMA